jgi:hypothetical protein
MAFEGGLELVRVYYWWDFFGVKVWGLRLVRVPGSGAWVKV